MIRRPPRSTPGDSSAASDVYKRQSLYYGVYLYNISKYFDVYSITNIADRRNYRNRNNLKKETKEQNGFFFHFDQAAY